MRHHNEVGFSHLGGSALNLVGNLAAKVVTSAIKSGTTGQLAQSIAKDMISDAKNQAINISHSHIDNLAGEIHRGLGVKIDTKDLKSTVSNKTNSFF